MKKTNNLSKTSDEKLIRRQTVVTMILKALAEYGHVFFTWQYGLPSKPILLQFKSAYHNLLDEYVDLVARNVPYFNNSDSLLEIKNYLTKYSINNIIFYEVPKQELDYHQFTKKTISVLELIRSRYEEKMLFVIPIIICNGELPDDFYNNYTVMTIDTEHQQYPEFIFDYEGTDEDSWVLKKIVDDKESWIQNVYTYWERSQDNPITGIYNRYYLDMKDLESVIL